MLHLLVYLNAIACDTLAAVVPNAIVVMCPLFRQFFVSSQLRNHCLLHQLLTFPFDVFGLFKTCMSVRILKSQLPECHMGRLTFASPVNV